MVKYIRPDERVKKDIILKRLKKLNICIVNENKYETTRDRLKVKCLICNHMWVKQIKKLLYKSSTMVIIR